MASGRCPGLFSINSIYRVNPFFHLTATTVGKITIVNTYVKNNFILHRFLFVLTVEAWQLETFPITVWITVHRSAQQPAAGWVSCIHYIAHCARREMEWGEMNQMNHGPGMFRPSLSLQSFTDQTSHHTSNIRLATPRHVDTYTRGGGHWSTCICRLFEEHSAFTSCGAASSWY